MDVKSGLTRIEAYETGKLAAVIGEATADGVTLFELSTAAHPDRAGFFDAIRKTLPLEPPVTTNHSWDALSDSLWQGIHLLEKDKIVIVWADGESMYNNDPKAHKDAVRVLKAVTKTLANPKLTRGRPTALAIYVA